MRKVVVFGGSGYVGQRVLKSLLKQGCGAVVSVSRSGEIPSDASCLSNEEKAKVQWRKADIFDVDSYRKDLNESYGVVSVIGAFGSNAYMERINGDANILCASTAKSAGVKRMVFVSTVENNLPDIFLNGYFNGKRRAEEYILSTFPNSSTILRPSFVYGTRSAAGGKLKIPLGFIGRPMEALFSLPVVRTLRASLPGMQAILAPPISVEAVGDVAAHSALCDDKGVDEKKILSVDDMVKMRESLGLV